MSPAPAESLPAAALCEMLLRQSPGCAWLLQRDGTFHAVYGGASRIFGRPAAELQTLRFADLFAPPSRPSWTTRLERVFAGETLCAVSRFGEGAPTFAITMFPIQPPDGEIAFAACLAHEMPEGGLVLRMLDALENDRARLPQLLHDRVGQTLSAAGLQLDLLGMDLAEAAIVIPQRIGEIQDLLDTAMGLVRDLNRELNPVAERLGLRTALDQLAGRLRADFKGKVRVFADATAQPAPEAAAALYRIAQEAANGAARRAGCSAIEILLKSLRSGPALEIRDNGPGFDRDAALQGGGLELLVMQHFADQAGIELQIDSAPDRGTVVRALCRSAGAEPRAHITEPGD
jgi:signal transduction histidine kinase